MRPPNLASCRSRTDISVKGIGLYITKAAGAEYGCLRGAVYGLYFYRELAFLLLTWKVFVNC